MEYVGVRRAWYQIDPAGFRAQSDQVTGAYPNLHVEIRDDMAILRGSFPLMENGQLIDQFLIEVELPPRFPRDVPPVREIGGRIPRAADRHIYLDTGTACLFVPDERNWVYPAGATLLDFLNGPVRSFFIGQSLYELTGEWPFGQRSHGVKGIVECYSERIGTTDLKTIRRYLDTLRKKDVKGHWPCPCGGGQILRRCHFGQVLELHNMIPHSVAQNSWRLLFGKTPV